MKKILFFIPLLFSFWVSYGQPEIQRASNNNTVVDPHLVSSRSFRTPIYNDTTQANNQFPSIDSVGKVIFTRDVQAHWSRVGYPLRWVRVGTTTSLTSSSSILVEGDGSDADPYVPSLIVSTVNNNAVVVNPDGVFVPTQVQNGLIEGGILTWVTGYTYDVSPARYGIQNIVYNTLQDQITFPNADTLPRFDQAYVDVDEDVGITQGVASETPVEPSYDPLTQVPLAFILIDSNSTAPPNIEEEYIYQNDDPGEWTATASNARIVDNSTNNPYSVPRTIEGTLTRNNDSIGFKAPSAPIMADFTVVTFKLRSKATWTSNQSIRLQWYNGTTAVGNPVFISNNVYGFISSSTAVYQTITIKLTDFNSIPTVTNLRITVQAAGSSTIGWYIDDIRLLGGDGVIIPQTGNDWHVGGNTLSSAGRIGSLTPHNVDVITGNDIKARFNNSSSDFELFYDLWLRGSNPGISFQSNTFANADYYIKRNGTSIQTNTASSIQTFIAGVEAYRLNVATGNIWYNASGTQFMQLDPSGTLKVGTNSSDTSALFLVNSTTRGSLPAPRVTTAQKNAIVSPATGLLVFDTSLGQYYYYNGASWVPFGGNVTASNGLSASSNNVTLGGSALTGNTSISTSAFSLTIPSSNTTNTLAVTNSSSGNAVNATSTNGIAILGVSNGVAQYGIQGAATNGGYAIRATGVGGSAGLYGETGVDGADGGYPLTGDANATNTNTESGILQLIRKTTGTAAAGIAGYIRYDIEQTNGNTGEAARLLVYLTDPVQATRTSAFKLRLYNSASITDALLVEADGTLTLGTAYQGLGAGYLAVSNTGEVTWSAGGGGGGGDALTANPLSQFAATTSAQLAGVISDETGSGGLVFATSPTLTTPNLGTPSAINGANASNFPISTAISGLGTNVATALAINVGSAGAFVTFNGAGGTPSSITLTNGVSLPIVAGTTGTLTVARGGTGLTALGLAGQFLRVNAGATALEFATISGSGTVISASGGTTGMSFTTPTTTPTLTGTLNVANGGTGQTSLQAALNALAGGVTNARFLRGNGVNVVLSQVNLAGGDVTGALLPINGGTGLTGALSGRIMVGDGSTWQSIAPTQSNGIVITMGAGTMNISQQFNPAFQTLSDAATTTWNVTNGANAVWTNTGTNRTLSITNPVVGHTYLVRHIQGAGGSHTISTYPTGTRWPNGGAAPTLTATVGAIDIFTFTWDGTNYWADYKLNY